MIRISLIFISLFAGLFSYLGFRTTHTPVYHWIVNLGLRNELNALRNTMKDIHLPDWLVYSMPDGLWMFSFIMSVLWIWNFKLNKRTGKWIFFAISIGLGFEIMQAFVKGIGVFDWNDLFFMTSGAALALCFCSGNRLSENSIQVKNRFMNQFIANN